MPFALQPRTKGSFESTAASGLDQAVREPKERCFRHQELQMVLIHQLAEHL